MSEEHPTAVADEPQPIGKILSEWEVFNSHMDTKFGNVIWWNKPKSGFIYASPPMEAGQRNILLDVTSSLAAAISLLEKSPKSGAPSNKMFDQMLVDYRASLERARIFLNGG